MLKTDSLIKPLITERSLKDAESGVYTFKVAKMMSKPEIRDTVNMQFGVHVQKITTATMHGKVRVAGKKRSKIQRPDWKKAKVRLKTGEKIEVFEVSTK